ncbi:hypothetical protein BE18_24135, partial [Sorangium cellulosum]
GAGGEGGEDPGLTSWALDVQPILEHYCAPCHTTNTTPSRGFRVTDWETVQLPAVHASCAGMTKGECALVRIKSGQMPRVSDPALACTGDPELDVDKAYCLAQDEQDVIQAWIDGGRQP